jgi:hypothetical protein
LWCQLRHVCDGADVVLVRIVGALLARCTVSELLG